MDKAKHSLTITFPSEKLKMEFATWMSHQGEQVFFEHLNIIDGPRVSFKYRNEDESLPKSNPKRYGPFLENDLIRVVER